MVILNYRGDWKTQHFLYRAGHSVFLLRKEREPLTISARGTDALCPRETKDFEKLFFLSDCLPTEVVSPCGSP